MALDKAKTLRAAEKFLEMGKIPAAIKEYCKVVESEPDDFTTLNVLGDLHVRVGNQPAAISCFRRIAEHYREQEFALKAIAMFKKIDRLKPHDVEIATCLADLYAQQDLLVEARAHYLMVADVHEKTGATQAVLEVLCKIADLDPQNTGVRIRLAEGYLSEGMATEAAASFTEAGHNLLANDALDEALKVFARSLELNPTDHETLNGVLAAHKGRGTADEAAEIIARAVEANADDVDLMSMLVDAHIEAEDPIAAEKTATALIAKDDSAYLRLSEIARLYLHSDKLADAVRVVAGISEQMIAQDEDAQLVELINELLRCDADNVEALRLLVRAYSAKRDVENLTAVLERLAEAAQTAGLENDERYALSCLVRLGQEQSDRIDRLNELGGVDEDASAELLVEFESVVAVVSEMSEGEFVIEADNASGETTEFEMTSDVADVRRESAAAMEIERGDAFEGASKEQVAVPSEDFSFESDGDQADRHAPLRAQELESVDFYIEQGYVDIAVDTLNLLESQFGKHADIERRRTKLAMLNGTDTEAAPPTLDTIEYKEPAPEVTPSAPVTAAQVIDPGLAEIFEEYRASAESEVKSNGDYETHYNLGLAYQEMDLFEEALEEFQIAIALLLPNDVRHLQCCNLIGHCFLQKGVPQLAVKWFQKGLNAPTATEDERQALRFDLAAAYEQAGELNRAVDLFTEVYGVNVSYRGVNERLRALQDRIAQ